MSRTVVIPFASRSGRINSRLPVGSLAPVRWTCISTSPGIRNFPAALKVFVPLGTEMDFDGPIAAIFSSEMKTVMSGLAAAPVASMRVTCVMASDGGGGEEHEQKRMTSAKNKNERPRTRPPGLVESDSARLLIREGRWSSIIPRGGYIFSAQRAVCREGAR